MEIGAICVSPTAEISFAYFLIETTGVGIVVMG